MRPAGVLLHISSLPSNYGIGTLGKEAYDFVDFLDKAGQKIWQILPIGPTSFGDSPYQALSAFYGEIRRNETGRFALYTKFHIFKIPSFMYLKIL